jgi:integrase
MTRPNESVTARTLARLAKTVGRHPVEGAKGLKLTVKPDGRGYWTYRYRLDGRETETSLGSCSRMTLKDAVTLHLEKHALVRKGINPQKNPRHAGAAPKTSGAPTFGEAAVRLIERRARNPDLRNARHARQFENSLLSLPPWFLGLKAKDIKPDDVRKIVEPIWLRTPETGARLRGRIAAVINLARDSEDQSPNPAAYSGWLKTQLGEKRVNRDPKTGVRVHHRALPYRDVPALMAALRERPDVAARALEYLVLTGARSGEVRGMTWAEIAYDYAEDVPESISAWILPAHRMKSFRPHRVPLSSAAVAILDEQRQRRDDSKSENPYVFPGGRPMRPLTNTGLTDALARVGFSAATSVHGLRASFRSWSKSVGVPHETAEEALAHAVGDATSRAYDRDDQLKLRVGLMEAWARYCMSATVLMLSKP